MPDDKSTTDRSTTDWKSVASELYAFIVGMMAASAQINGKSVEDAHVRARKLFDECVSVNTRKRGRDG